MTNGINPLGTAHAAGSLSSESRTAPLSDTGPLPGQVSFQDVLLNSLEQVNQMDRQAQTAIASGLADNELSQAEIFTAVKKADLAFRTMLQIRNKLMEAYNEIKQMRM